MKEYNFVELFPFFFLSAKLRRFSSKNKELGIFFVMLLRQVMCFATKRTHRGNWCRKDGLKATAKKVVHKRTFPFYIN